MKEEDHYDVDRRPRCVEEREQPFPAQELADVGQVAEGLSRIAAPAAQVALEGGVEDARVELQVEGCMYRRVLPSRNKVTFFTC